MKNFKQWLESSKNQNSKVITITCQDLDNSLEDLLNHIKDSGNIGHSFSIIVDPDNREYKKEFGWDGDGSDRIYSIDVKKTQNESMTSTACIAGFARPTIPSPVKRTWMGEITSKKKVYEQPQVKESFEDTSIYDIITKHHLEKEHGWTPEWVNYWFQPFNYLDDHPQPPENNPYSYHDQFVIEPNISLESARNKGYYWMHTPDGYGDSLKMNPQLQILLNTKYATPKHALNHAVDLGFKVSNPNKKANDEQSALLRQKYSKSI